MKRMAALAAAGVLAAVSANAQFEGFNIGAGWSHLDGGDLRKADGLVGRLKVNMSEIVAVEGRASYLRYDIGDVGVVPIEAALSLNLPIGDAVVAYAGAGAGYYYFLDGDVGFGSEIGFFPMGGIEVNLIDFFAFAEVRSVELTPNVDIAKHPVSGLAEVADADVGGFGFSVGLGLRF